MKADYAEAFTANRVDRVKRLGWLPPIIGGVASGLIIVKNLVWLSSLFALCAPVQALAYSEAVDESTYDEANRIVVTASRDADGVAYDMLGTSTTLLSAEDLSQRQTVVVSDILRDVPGVAVNRSGAVGALTSVRIRGAESNHTMVLIDGIEASDPAGGLYDFASLFADEGARIEVLRGEQSALYGSDAIGGVVHYITASGRERPGASLIAEAGSFGTWRLGGRMAGIVDDLDYAITASFTDMEGYVVAPEGSRKIGANNRNLSGKFGYDLSGLQLRLIGRYNRIKADSNDQDYLVTGNAIDDGGTYHAENLYGLVGAAFATSSAWQHDISLQAQSSVRDMLNMDGSLNRGSVGRRTKASWVSNLDLGRSGNIAHKLTTVLDWERESYRNAGPVNALNPLRAIKNLGLVAQYHMLVEDRGSIILALRHDDNSRFRNNMSWRASASWKVTDSSRLHAAAGTGKKAPTFAELYGYSPTANYIGNPQLKAETSLGWEVGVEQGFWADRLLIDITYFSARLKDQIIDLYAPVYTSVNAAGKTPHRGVEASFSANLGAGFSLKGQYSHIHSEDDLGNPLIRRPKNMASANLLWQASDDAGSINLNVRHNGEMLDTNFATYVTAPLKAYTLVNLAGEARLYGNIRVHARIENLLNEDYVENVGYLTPGRGVYGGMRVAF